MSFNKLTASMPKLPLNLLEFTIKANYLSQFARTELCPIFLCISLNAALILKLGFFFFFLLFLEFVVPWLWNLEIGINSFFFFTVEDFVEFWAEKIELYLFTLDRILSSGVNKIKDIIICQQING
jgi:hypothetical protein